LDTSNVQNPEKVSTWQRFLNKYILRVDEVSPTGFTLALALAAAVKKIFKDKADKKFSSEPLLEKKLITQFVGRMRIDAMQKFNRPTVFSTIHFYKDAKQMSKNKPIGVLIVYIERKYILELLHILKYPPIDDDEEEEVKDACGALCNIIAGYFRNEMISLGYPTLEMSPFHSYINSAINGVDYCVEEIYKYEVSFEIQGDRRLVTEMVMGPLRRA